MKISRLWLQKYFNDALPSADVLADALTFHAFEIEGVEKHGSDEVLDVKITPNRGHDALCHRGVAKEISAILDLPLLSDPLADVPDLSPVTNDLSVSIEDPLCYRYIAGYIRGVKVGPSPKWLAERLEAIGQRSINNVVDATNFVMFNLGQPLHAFDAGKLQKKGARTDIAVRRARKGEKIAALDGKEYILTDSMLVIADAEADTAIGIAGVKGGTPASITEETTDIILESANFNGVSVRKTAQALRLRTDASARFEQVMSPDLAAFGMRSVADLILKIAGGELSGFVDTYPKPQEKRTVSVDLADINGTLGVSLRGDAVESVFSRLGFAFEKRENTFAVSVPFERLDITVSEDLIEEVGRIIGYDKVGAIALPPLPTAPVINKNFYWSEKIREFLVSRGFSEVYTPVFSEKGMRAVLNNVSSDKPYLRSLLELDVVLERNIQNKELLGLSQVRVFEIGAVWAPEEKVVVGIAVEPLKKRETARDIAAALAAHLGTTLLTSKDGAVIELELDHLIEALPVPERYEEFPSRGVVRYEPFSRFPYIVRDVAVWTPPGTDADEILRLIQTAAGALAVRTSLFDRFEKEGRLSLAYRLVFQSFERTLQDEEATVAMESVYAALKAKGFEIR